MPSAFLHGWAEAARVSVGFFWMALWAFILGYALSGAIQVFVTRERMRSAMGGPAWRGVLLGTVFGFVSSSCSFSALATTRALFAKGARFVAAVAFLLASTNLVIELGIVLSVFLGPAFVAGEYLGGLMLIACAWGLIALLRPRALVRRVRERLDGGPSAEGQGPPLARKLRSRAHWARVGRQYAMEWQMVWKDVTIGFTVAGIVAAFVPDAFFRALFIGSGEGATSFPFPVLLEHVLVAPAAAFLTFIGSMGNVPLAALLYGKGVSFAGVMAFLFSDLVVFPVLRIHARYYGWPMALFLLGLLLASLVVTALALHGLFGWFGALPEPAAVAVTERDAFRVDYTLWLNAGFLALTAVLLWLGYGPGGRTRPAGDGGQGHHGGHGGGRHGGHGDDGGHAHHAEHDHAMASKGRAMERVLRVLALAAFAWLAVGLAGWALGW